MNRRTFLTEFPELSNDDKAFFCGLLGVLCERGFVDTSWHNDAAPSLSKELKNIVVRLWVDCENPYDRELAESPRFTVSVYDLDMNWLHDEIQTDFFIAAWRGIELAGVKHNEN